MVVLLHKRIQSIEVSVVKFSNSLQDILCGLKDKSYILFTPSKVLLDTSVNHHEIPLYWFDFIERYKGLPRSTTVVFFGISEIHQRILGFLTLSRCCEVVIIPNYGFNNDETVQDILFECYSDYPQRSY